MIITEKQLIILLLTFFGAGFAFGFLAEGILSRASLSKIQPPQECEIHEQKYNCDQAHAWDYGVDRSKEGWPFVRKCNVCGKGEILE